MYRHAIAVQGVTEREGLYIITGCIRSENWALAAFSEPMDPEDILRLERVRDVCDTDPEPGLAYAWTRTAGNSEALCGGGTEKGLKNQSLFLRGFKLEFSKAFRSRIKESCKSLPPGGRLSPSTISHKTEKSDGTSGDSTAGGGPHLQSGSSVALASPRCRGELLEVESFTSRHTSSSSQPLIADGQRGCVISRDNSLVKNFQDDDSEALQAVSFDFSCLARYDWLTELVLSSL